MTRDPSVRVIALALVVFWLAVGLAAAYALGVL